MLAATPLITIFAHRRPALGRDALEAVMDCALPFRLEFAAFAQVPPHRLTVGHFFRFVRKDDFPLSAALMAFFGSDGAPPPGTSQVPPQAPQQSPGTAAALVRHRDRGSP